MAYTVEIDWCGHTTRREGVQGTLTEAIDLFGTARYQPRTFGVRGWRFDGISIAAQRLRGHTLDTAIGRVYRGDKLVLSGRVRRPTGGRDSDGLSCIIEERAAGIVSWPSSTAVDVPIIDEAANAFRPKQPPVVTEIQSTQLVFPVVFGRPGMDIGKPLGADASAAGSPAVWVDSLTGWVIADAPTEAATVHMHLEDGTSDGPITVQTGVADDGRTVAYVQESDLSGVGLLYTDRPEKLYTRWSGGQARDGRLSRVLHHLLRYMPRRVATQRIQAMAPALDAYRVDTYFITSQSIEDVVARLLEPLPVSMVQGEDGVWMWVWVPEAPPVGELRFPADHTEATGVFGASWTEGEASPYRSYRIRYLPLLPDDEYLYTTTTRGSQYRATDAQVDGSDEVVEAPHIADGATAQRCADLRMRARGRPSIVVQARIYRWLWERYGIGQTVTVQHPEIGLVDRPGVITRTNDDGTDVLDIEITCPARTP